MSKQKQSNKISMYLIKEDYSLGIFDDIENAMIQSVKDKANIVKSVIKIG